MPLLPSLPDEVELPEDDFDDAPLALSEDCSPEEPPKGPSRPEGPLRVPEGPPCDVFTTSPLGPGSCPVSLSLDLSSRDTQWVSEHLANILFYPGSSSTPSTSDFAPQPSSPFPTNYCCSLLLFIFPYLSLYSNDIDSSYLHILIFSWREFWFYLIFLSPYPLYPSKAKKDTTGTLIF